MNSNNSLVPFGTNLALNVGKPRFNSLVASMVVLTPFVFGVVIGLLLSDGYLQFLGPAALNAKLGLTQSLAHFKYMWFVFFILGHYCISYPKLRVRNKSFGTFFNLELRTRALPCFTAIYHMFYNEGLKFIPLDIFNILTPVALAHWIAGDGSWTGHGVILCTHSFTIPDVVRLMNVLMVRYRLDCTLQYDRGLPVIYIKAGSMPLLRSIVLEHMEPSMLHKIGLK